MNLSKLILAFSGAILVAGCSTGQQTPAAAPLPATGSPVATATLTPSPSPTPTPTTPSPQPTQSETPRPSATRTTADSEDAESQSTPTAKSEKYDTGAGATTDEEYFERINPGIEAGKPCNYFAYGCKGPVNGKKSRTIPSEEYTPPTTYGQEPGGDGPYAWKKGAHGGVDHYTNEPNGGGALVCKDGTVTQQEC